MRLSYEESLCYNICSFGFFFRIEGTGYENDTTAEKRNKHNKISNANAYLTEQSTGHTNIPNLSKVCSSSSKLFCKLLNNANDVLTNSTLKQDKK